MNRFSETGEVTLDINSIGSVTTPLEVNEGAASLTAYVAKDSGTVLNCVVTLQVSPDDSTWFDTEETITGEGHIDSHVCIAKRARLMGSS